MGASASGSGQRAFAVIRSWTLADLLTAGNLACGLATVFVAVGEAPRVALGWAAGLVPAALVFDCLDGVVARWRGTCSPRGRELDSLADVVSFGVAPAAVAYAAGYRGGWDGVVLVFFVFCGLSRLARFNVTAAALAEQGEAVRGCQGVPIPYSVVPVVALAGLEFAGRLDAVLRLASVRLGPWTLHPTVLAFVCLGVLMVSTRVRLEKPSWWG